MVGKLATDFFEKSKSFFKKGIDNGCILWYNIGTVRGREKKDAPEEVSNDRHRKRSALRGIGDVLLFGRGGGNSCGVVNRDGSQRYLGDVVGVH